MKNLALVPLLLCSCGASAPELQPFERGAGAAALQAWRASGLPEPDKGRCDVSLFRVHLATSTTDMQQICGMGSSAEFDAGCTGYGSTNRLFAWREYPIVVISPTWKSEPGIVIHELMHAYWHCSGLPNEMGAGNVDHQDSRVWAAAGGATSAQGRALAIVATQTTLP